jgi:hypothetical protein
MNAVGLIRQAGMLRLKDSCCNAPAPEHYIEVLKRSFYHLLNIEKSDAVAKQSMNLVLSPGVLYGFIARIVVWLCQGF